MPRAPAPYQSDATDPMPTAVLLQCMSPEVAHRVRHHRRELASAFGVKRKWKHVQVRLLGRD
jgi:hypothetical protein